MIKRMNDRMKRTRKKRKYRWMNILLQRKSSARVKNTESNQLSSSVRLNTRLIHFLKNIRRAFTCATS